MNLFHKIIKLYPELDLLEAILNNIIRLQNDGDEKGDYIKEWNHPTLPRPTQEQLDGID